jgi:hypothetical protein
VSFFVRASKFGAASPVTPRFISRSDPAAQETGARKGHAFFAYANKYLIDTDRGVIVDVGATCAIDRRKLERREQCWSERRLASAQSPHSWPPTGLGGQPGLAGQRERHCPAYPSLQKIKSTDGKFSRANFIFDAERRYTCPRARSLSNSDAHTPFPEAASQPRAQGFIAPANWIATSANSKRVAAPTPSLTRSHGICTKTPVAARALRNAGICGGLSS